MAKGADHGARYRNSGMMAASSLRRWRRDKRPKRVCCDSTQTNQRRGRENDKGQRNAAVVLKTQVQSNSIARQ